MGKEQAPTEKGRQAAAAFRKETAKEERKVEQEKGSHLKKGPERFEERAYSSDKRTEK